MKKKLHPLQVWRKEMGISREELVKIMDCSMSSLISYELSNRVPHLSRMKSFYTMSLGELTPNDFYPVNDWKEEIEKELILGE